MENLDTGKNNCGKLRAFLRNKGPWKQMEKRVLKVFKMFGVLMNEIRKSLIGFESKIFRKPNRIQMLLFWIRVTPFVVLIVV